MDDTGNKIAMNYRLQNKSSYIVLFIGYCFILIAILNVFLKIPVEYIIGISFAAFFFILTDLMQTLASEEKPPNEQLYLTSLFLAVLSFILVPLIISSSPDFLNFMTGSSEFVTILSFGLVIVIIHLKRLSAQRDFYTKLSIQADLAHESAEETQALIEKFQERFEDIVERQEESNKEKLKLIEELISDSKKYLNQNFELIKLIEEGESLEEIKEKVKSY